jgi:hypothetical protein
MRAIHYATTVVLPVIGPMFLASVIHLALRQFAQSNELGAHGPFDFASPLGDQKELVRFRQDQREAVLDFHKVWLPSLQPLPGFDSQGQNSRLGDDGFTVSDLAARNPKASDPQPMHDY